MKYLTIIFTMLVGVFASNAYGSLNITFLPSTSNFVEGSSIDVDVFLEGTEVDAGTFAANFKLSRTGSAGQITGATSNPGFDLQFSANFTDDSVDYEMFSTNAVLPVTISKLKLGSFTLVGNVIGSGTITALPFDPDPTYTGFEVGNDFFTSAQITFGSFNYTVSAVPEPTSIIFGSIVAAAGGVGAWKRRRRSLKGEVGCIKEKESLST